MNVLKNSNLILLLGVLASAIFWCLDASIDVYFFSDEDENKSVLESILSPNAHEIYMRGIVLILFAIVSVFARSLLIKQENLNSELTHHKSNLENVVLLRTKQLEKLASIDDLTQIYNRRKFFELVECELGRTSRYQRPLSIIMIDIDYFKNINDQFGHQAGDLTLQILSKLISDTIRTTDIFGRVGGEEFALALPETTKNAARDFAERIRLCVEKENFPSVEKITLSLGVTQFNTEDTKDSVFNRADIALYGAKEAGRNKVVTA